MDSVLSAISPRWSWSAESSRSLSGSIPGFGHISAASHDGWDPSTAVGWHEAVADFCALSGAVPPSQHDPPVEKQRDFSKLVDCKCRDDLIAGFASSPRDQARLRSVGAAGSSSWLQVIPSFKLRLTFDPREYRILIRFWLGLNLGLPSPAFCPGLTCRMRMDDLGYHALTCQTGGGLGVRHNALREAFIHFCKLAGITESNVKFVDSFQALTNVQLMSSCPAQVFVMLSHLFLQTGLPRLRRHSCSATFRHSICEQSDHSRGRTIP